MTDRRPDAIPAAYAYYVSILNSRFMSLKTISAMIAVMRGAYLAYVGSTALDLEQNSKGKFRLGPRFVSIWFWFEGVYCVLLSFLFS